MEELTLIIQQRRKSIAIITSNQEEIHKFQLIEEQRKRNQRQNWILRVLKSIKMLSVEQKRVIYETTYRMMTYFQDIQPLPTPAFDSVNFLELMINLFVDFFNRFQSLDFTHLKSIIRPNNNFIVVDLLKTLIEIGRKEFKIAIQEKFKEQMTVRHDRKLSVRSLVRLPAINQKIDQLKNQQVVPKKKPKEVKISLQTKLRYALFEKYSKIAQTCNFQQLYQRANELYFELLFKNQRNSVLIQKYRDLCFGNKKHINYDATGLYTQEEIKKLVQDQKERNSLRISEMRELRGECSAEQLKEYFKMQVQLYESSVCIPSFVKENRLQKWFPFCLLKNGDKLHPFNLVVPINGSYFSIQQFQERHGKRIRAYMKELILDVLGETFDAKVLADPDYVKFPKKDFISYQNAKIIDLLHEQYLVKEPLFPAIFTEEGLPRQKAKSETKISNKSFAVTPLKPVVERQLNKKLNYSSILKDGFPTRRRIDSLIEQFVRIREITK